MKCSINLFALTCVTALHIVFGSFDAGNPMLTTINLISQLQSRMIAKGEASQKIYNEFSGWCQQRAQDMNLELTDDMAEKRNSEAQIEQDESTIKTEDIKGDKEADDIAVSDVDLKKAASLRKKEAAIFKQEEKELMETISMLKRAQAVLERQQASGTASMLQVQGASTLSQVLSMMVQASLVNSDDAHKLAALLQTARKEANYDDDDLLAAPTTVAYDGSSGTIVQVLADLLEKSESQLEEIRSKEQEAINNFRLIKQSLKDEIKFSSENKATANTEETKAKEAKSIDEGDLGTTVKDVEADVKNLADLRKVCMQKVEEFTAMHNSRDKEIKALSAAKKALQDETGAATTMVYSKDEESFLQIRASGKLSSLQKAATRSQTAAASLSKEVLRTVKKLAIQLQSHDLAQFASRMTVLLRTSAKKGESPFAKVVGMISDMIRQLEDEAIEDKNHKEYCDQQLADAKQKQSDRTDFIQQLSIKIDQMNARSKKLQKHIATLQDILAKLDGAQAALNKVRHEEHAEYKVEKKDLDQGIDGVKTALNTLNQYYGNAKQDHVTQSQASANIISLLETVESDFSQTLAELTSSEDASLHEYEAQTQQNELTRTSKQKEVQALTKQVVSLDKAIVDSKSDRSGLNSELSAVQEYLAKLKSECSAPVNSYEEVKLRRDQEIAGLKDALDTLESETALLQKYSRRKLRGPISRPYLHAEGILQAH